MSGVTQSRAFKASKSDPDTLTCDEAMTGVDCDHRIAAAKKQVGSLEDHGTRTETDLAEAASKTLPPVSGSFDASSLLMEASTPTKLAWWQEAIWNRESSKSYAPVIAWSAV